MSNRNATTQHPIERILPLFKGAKELHSGRGGYVVCCPAHNDQNPSLQIWEDQGDSHVGLQCFAGCERKAIVEAIGLALSDLYIDGKEHQAAPSGGIDLLDLAADKMIHPHVLNSLGVTDGHKFARKRAVHIPYYTTDGRPYERYRIRTALAAKEGSYWSRGKASLLPYGLERLADARAATYLVIVEGESDCWTLWTHGLPALGIPGAMLTSCIELHYLEGIERVYIMQESDPAGRKFAGELHKHLLHIGYKGEQYILDLTSFGAKDPNALHKRDIKAFKATFEQAMNQARQVGTPADVDISADIASTDPPGPDEMIRVHGVSNVWAVPGRAIFGKDRRTDEPVELFDWCPKVIRHIFIKDASQHDRHVYTLENEGEQADCSDGELNDGSAWSKFSNLTGIVGTKNITVLGNAVKEVARKKGAPEFGYATVGWQKAPDGRSVYVIEDGRGLDGSLYHVLNTQSLCIEHGKQRMPHLPLPEQGIDESEALWTWVFEASPEGHQALSIAKQFRAYLNDILEAFTTFVICSKQEGRNASRLGKTTIELFSHNLSFRTYYKDSPHASFTGTSGSIEKKIARQQSGNCLIDDLNFPPTARLKDIEDKAHVLEMIVRTSANNAEARSRLRKNQQLAESSRFETLPGITGEKLPGVLSSLERRMISIFIDVGEIDIDCYRDGEEENASRLLKLGHMALRTLEKLRTQDNDSVRYDLSQIEKEAEKRLRSGLSEELPRQISQLCDDLPTVYARILAGMRALGLYAYGETIGEKWEDRLYPFVLHFLIEQVNRMEGFIDSSESGSLTSLIHILRDEIATNKPVSNVRYRIADRKSRACPEIIGSDGDEIERRQWGWPASSNDDEKVEYSFLAYTDINGNGEYVLYPTENFYTELRKKADQLEEYRQFRTKKAIEEALEAEGWIARRGRDRTDVQVRLPGINEKKHRELKLSLYLDDFSVGTAGTMGTNRLEQGEKRIEDSTQVVPAEKSNGYSGYKNENEQVVPIVPTALNERVQIENGSTGLKSTPTEVVPVVPIVPTENTKNSMQLSHTIPPHPERCSSCGNESDWHVNRAHNAWLCMGTKCTNRTYYFRDLRGQSAQKVIPSPAAQVSAPDTEQGEQQQWVTIFADIRAGRALTEQGIAFTFPSDCSLSTFLTEATKITGVNRVFLCGARPGGDSAKDFNTWLLDARMMDEYITRPGGHSLNPLKPDSSVAHYVHRFTRKSIDIRRIMTWLGDDRDEQDAPLYSIEDARAALALTEKYLRQFFPSHHNFKHLGGTPSSTFKALWTEGNRIAGKKFEPLSEEIQALIRQNAGQGRIEFFGQHSQGKLPGLYYYDGIFTYAALTREMPTELAIHDHKNEYAGYAAAHYRIRYTVPASWQHVGLFMTKRTGTHWREQDGWFYPGASEAGQTFETWANGAELHVAYNLPPGMPAWDITILERIVFKPEKESSVKSVLETITSTLIRVREQIDKDKRQDVKRVRLYDLARGAVRNILLHGIGSFYRSNQVTRTYLRLDTEPAPAGYTDAEQLNEHLWVYQVLETSTDTSMSHPEWAALIWARCRARMTRAALSRPYNDIIAIRTDAIAVTHPVASWEANTKVGQLRRKWAVTKSLPAPATTEKLDELQHKILGR
jgi:hypothetical protein